MNSSCNSGGKVLAWGCDQLASRRLFSHNAALYGNIKPAPGLSAATGAESQAARFSKEAHCMPQQSKDKIYWHSRRGMLELDLLLMPFAREVYETLPAKDQLLYTELLEEEDQDLWSWLMERAEPSRPEFKTIISQILAHNSRGD
jgi:antitoxin CptB